MNALDHSDFRLFQAILDYFDQHDSKTDWKMTASDGIEMVHTANTYKEHKKFSSAAPSPIRSIYI